MKQKKGFPFIPRIPVRYREGKNSPPKNIPGLHICASQSIRTRDLAKPIIHLLVS